MNFNLQYYNGIPLKLIKRNYFNYKAKRFLVNNTNQNFWIPNCYLEEDGTIKKGVDLSFIFNTKTGLRKLKLAKVVKRNEQ